MKNVILLMILLNFKFIPCHSTAIITGTVTNFKSRIVSIEQNRTANSNAPVYYGDRFQRECINHTNRFKFKIETLAEYSVYTLYFKGVREACFDLILKDHDSINIDVDLQDFNNSFRASGTGSDLCNLCFALEMFRPKRQPSVNDDQLLEYWDKKEKTFLSVIHSFKQGEMINNENMTSDQTNIINRLIKGTHLNAYQFDLIQNRVKYFCLTAKISGTSIDYQLSHVHQDYQLLQALDLSKNTLENDYITSLIREDLIRVSTIQELVNLKGAITGREAYTYFKENKYKTAKKILKEDEFQRYISDALYGLLVDGNYSVYKELYETYSESITKELYKNKLNEFYHNYLEALTNKTYNLNSSTKILNDSTVQNLLQTLKGQKVYLIVWKNSPETSYTLTPLWELPFLKKIQHASKGKNIKFVDICLSNDSLKQHWASMIINHHWEGEHYFYSNGNKEEFRKRFNVNDKMDHCSGELYYIMDDKGNIIKNNGSEVIDTID